jgi:phage/plasmid-like protein (TIGR03299 family)
MSHGLTSTDYLFSVGEMPWHGLGAVLAAFPANSAEATTSARAGWCVEETPLAFADRQWATVREDTGDLLGVVEARHPIVQNGEAFSALDELLGGAARFETAGTLCGGRRIWAQARPPACRRGTTPEPYVLLSNAHDGSAVLEVARTPIRVVCIGTLVEALRCAHRRVSLLAADGEFRRLDALRPALALGEGGA